MSSLKMAACGIDCKNCSQYKVTVENDLKAAESLIEWFRSQGWIEKDDGVEAILNKKPLCYGCWNITDDCFWKCGCGSVDFRICCKEKKINHCGECIDFPCEHYEKWSNWHESHKKAMEYLKSIK